MLCEAAHTFIPVRNAVCGFDLLRHPRMRGQCQSGSSQTINDISFLNTMLLGPASTGFDDILRVVLGAVRA